MPAAVPDWWDVSRSHRGVCRVEVWSNGERVEPDAQILAGTVREVYATGLRANLSLSVEPSSKWLEWATLPGLEIRPFSGLVRGGEEFLLPLGRFPILPPTITLPAESAVSITADDYWSWTQRARHGAEQRPARMIRDVVAQRIRISGLPKPVNTATSEARMPSGAWDAGSEADLMKELLESIAATAYVDREGVPRIEDREPVIGLPMGSGETGTVISISTTRDWSKVVNRWTVSSTNNDVKIPPAIASINDPHHPAYHKNGLGWVDAEYSSPYFTTVGQEVATARMLLARDSKSARSWTVTAVPDASRMPGDLTAVVSDLGTFTSVVQEITHDLTGGPMSLTLGAV